MEQYITVDGLKTRYVEEGGGPVVLFLHGLALGSSLEVYGKNIPVFAKAGLRAIAFDQPAFGLTDQPRDYSDEYRANMVLKFMDALSIEKAHLVGHSNTGASAARLAMNYSNRVEKFVALACFPLLPLLSDQKGGGPELQKNAPTLEDVRTSLERDFFNKFLITDDFVQLRYRFSTGKNFEAFLKARQGEPDWYAGDTPLWNRFARSSVGKLYLYAKEDRAGAAKRFAVLADMKLDLNMQLIEGCSHLVMMDQPEQFNRRVIDFVKG